MPEGVKKAASWLNANKLLVIVTTVITAIGSLATADILPDQVSAQILAVLGVIATFLRSWAGIPAAPSTEGK